MKMGIGEINNETIYHLIEEVTVKGVAGLTGRVGCVYPKGEKGYFLRSNLGKCICIEGADGYFFAEVAGDMEMKQWYVCMKHRVAMDSRPANLEGWVLVEIPGGKAWYTIKGKEVPDYKVAIAIAAGQITMADIV